MNFLALFAFLWTSVTGLWIVVTLLVPSRPVLLQVCRVAAGLMFVFGSILWYGVFTGMRVLLPGLAP